MESEVPKESPSPPAPEVVVPVSQPQPVKKPFKLNKWHVVAIVLIVIIGVQVFLYVSLAERYRVLDSQYQSLLSDYARLESDYHDLQSNHDSLQSSYDSLLASYSSLQASYGIMQASYAGYSSLQSSYDSLQADYSALQDSHSSLQGSYSSLQSSYSSLQSSYRLLQTSYTTLQESYAELKADYKSLQASFDSFYSDYAFLRDQINQRAMYLDIEEFITPNDTAVESTVFSITGGWSDSSDWNEYWNDVHAMYSWVVNNVEYRYDGLFPIMPFTPSDDVEYINEMWQFPNETLDLMKGDCEDMAILLTSMLRSYNGEEYAVECILIESSTSGHVAVQFPVTGDKLTILDPAGHYFTSDIWGDLSSEDISTEINNWLSYWKPTMGSDVRVYRVFSSYMDEWFSSTSEYVTWMINRYT